MASGQSISSCSSQSMARAAVVGDGHAELGVADDDLGVGEAIDLVPVVERQPHRAAPGRRCPGERARVGELRRWIWSTVRGSRSSIKAS